jgi:hypothetical protein
MPAVKTATTSNYETVWAILHENALQMDKLRERQEELRESQKETDRIVKEIGKRFGDFTNSFGDVVEHMIAPKLQEKFLDFDLDFQMASKDIKIRDKKNNISFQIDILLQNGELAMLVEIKATLTISDINTHIERLEKMRKYSNLHGDKRTFLGAVAGITIPENAKEYALNYGIYLIEPTGEDFCILPPYNKHKEW